MKWNSFIAVKTNWCTRICSYFRQRDGWTRYEHLRDGNNERKGLYDGKQKWSKKTVIDNETSFLLKKTSTGTFANIHHLSFQCFQSSMWYPISTRVHPVILTDTFTRAEFPKKFIEGHSLGFSWRHWKRGFKGWGKHCTENKQRDASNAINETPACKAAVEKGRKEAMPPKGHTYFNWFPHRCHHRRRHRHLQSRRNLLKLTQSVWLP